MQIIRKKRDGESLNEQEIRHFVEGLSDGSLPVEQVAALAMAICLNGMTFRETQWLTQFMTESGEVLTWSDQALDGPTVDKHSTGGVGDKVSLVLAPLLAACGAYVPMISGKGLGHSGGTLDKLSAIPGYNIAPSLEVFRRVVKSAGCGIVGQTQDLAPADGRLYGVRDITATVESIPLITASILSKKAAAGLSGLIMDIKVGSGAFMADLDQAKALGQSLVATAGPLGLKCHALITDMNQVLGSTAGNALEVQEAVRFLANETMDARLLEVVLRLCAEALYVSGLARTLEEGRAMGESALSSGQALQHFEQMIGELGGPRDFAQRWDTYLPRAPVIQPVYSDRSGYLSHMDVKGVGMAVVDLGGGRKKLNDELDLSVGFSDFVGLGSVVDGQQPLAMVHAPDEDSARCASNALRESCVLSEDPPAVTTKLVYDQLVPESI